MSRQKAFLIQRYKTYIQVMDNGYIYFGDGKDAYLKADATGVTLSGSITISGDIALTGDIALATEDVSVVQGRKVFFDSQDGTEYIYSDFADNLMVNAKTWTDFAINGTDKVRLETAKLSIYAGVYVDIYNNLGVQGGVVVNGNTTVAYIGCSSLVCTGNATIQGADVGIAGTLTVITAINNGYDAAGGAVNMYADTTGGGAFFDPTADTNKGSFSIGASGGSKGTDFFAYGTTNGNYLQWDQSADDLLLVGTATQLAVAGTTDSSNSTSGSLRTAGGLGVAMAANIGTTLGIGGLITSTSVTGFRSNPTFVPDTTYTNYAFSVGNKVAGLTVNFANAAAQNFNPIQAIVNCTATGTGPTDSSQTNLFFAQLTHNTNAMTNLRLKCADFTTIVGKNVLDAYAYQGEIDFTTGAVTVGGEAAVLGLVMNAGASTVTGNLRGAIISMQGAVTGATAVGLEIRTSCGAGLTTALSEGIRIAGTPIPVVGIAMGNQTTDNEGPQNAFYFPSIGGADEGPCVASGTATGAITIKIGSDTRFIRFWDTA